MVKALLVGSDPLTNIDPTARDPANGRSQIRRFAFPEIQILIFPPPPLAWASGRVIAYGIRNPAGFAFGAGPAAGEPSLPKTLFVVESGASIDGVSGLTSEFVNDNPSDELEHVTYHTGSLSAAPKSYGFPDCTSLWDPLADPVGVPQYTGFQRGDQFSLNLDPLRDDNWCRTPANNRPAVLNFQVNYFRFLKPSTVTS